MKKPAKTARRKNQPAAAIANKMPNLTGRKWMEEQLAESRNYLDQIINSIPDPIFVKDRQHRWVLLNEDHNNLLGCDTKELLGKTDYDIFPKSEADVFWSKDEAVFTTGMPNINEEKLTDAKGIVHTVITKKSLYTNEKGGKFIVGIIRDITEHKRAVEKLKASEARYHRLFEAARDGILILNAETGIIVDVNPFLIELLGFSREAFLGKKLWDVGGVKDIVANQAHFAELQQKGYIHYEDMPLETSDGRRIEVEFVSHLYLVNHQKMIQCNIRGITERKHAEETLRTSEEKYRSLFENSRDAIMTIEPPSWRFTSGNPAAVKMFGAKNEQQFISHGPRDLSPERQPDGRASAGKTSEMIETAMREGSCFFDWTHRRISGEEFPATVLFSKMRSAGKEFLQATVRDMTERKRTEERIREQAALLDAANDAIYVRSLEHTVTYWNDGAERLYGWMRAEALGRKIHEMIKYDVNVFETAQAALLAQGSWSGELKMTNKTGKTVIVFCRWTLLRDESGRPKEVLAINTDITERKQLETNFLRAQRLEGIGSLAGGIAHDLNNILQPILMAAPLLRETTSDPESRKMLDTVKTCARRGADIIKQLLTFARGEPDVRVPLPVRHLLSEMNNIIRETFPRNIQLRVSVPKDLWLVIGDATQVHQALMNLCVNARDAMSDGGTLTLAAENLTLDAAFAAVIPHAKPGSYVCVSVTDTGTGIPPEHMDRIFSPFFTTKEIGKGTGLGLATVLGIVRGHGGFVRVNSQVGKGTTFELYLPASLDAKTDAPSDQEVLPPRADGELILVVDDEAGVRVAVQRTLENHGYRVVTAAEGAEAMALFAKHHTGVRAVLTDMMMPGMDGPPLVRALRQLEPQLPVLGMTGVGEKADIKELESLNLLALLTKPFTRDALLAALHQMPVAAGRRASLPPP